MDKHMQRVRMPSYSYMAETDKLENEIATETTRFHLEDSHFRMHINLRNYKVSLIVPLIGGLWSLSSWALSDLWGYGFFQGIGPSVIVMSFLGFYDQVLWKLPLFNLLNTIPDLNGRYEGRISFNYNNVDRHKDCVLCIKQSCSFIKVITTFTGNSESDTQSISNEAFIKTDELGDHHLYFYYHNRGSCKNGDTLNPHDGMNVLEIQREQRTIRLKGYYFTNRDPQTKGCLEAIKIQGGQ